MVASLAYKYYYIAPFASPPPLYIHGYSDHQAVNYSAVVYIPEIIFDRVNVAIGHINITQGETFRHVDDTVARKVYVQNLAPNNCSVDILEIVEEF